MKTFREIINESLSSARDLYTKLTVNLYDNKIGDWTFKKLVDLDPTPQKKYLDWIVKKIFKDYNRFSHQAGDFEICEKSQIKDLFIDFGNVVQNLERKDINQYKSFDDLYVVVQGAKEKKEGNVLGIKNLTPGKDYNKIFDNGKVIVFEILSFIGSRAIGGNQIGPKFKNERGDMISTAWCTVADREHYVNHKVNGQKLYYVMDLENNQKWAVHTSPDDPFRPTIWHVKDYTVNKSVLEKMGIGLKLFIPPKYLIFSGDIDNVKYAIEKGADLNKHRPDETESYTPLTNAIENIGDANIVELLINAGADINKKDGGSITPLECAIYNNNLDITKLLLDAGAIINKKVSLDDVRSPSMVKLLTSYGVKG